MTSWPASKSLSVALTTVGGVVGTGLEGASRQDGPSHGAGAELSLDAIAPLSGVAAPLCIGPLFVRCCAP
jgi:hypothetical protein